jgi:hypothetical protein
MECKDAVELRIMQQLDHFAESVPVQRANDLIAARQL